MENQASVANRPVQAAIPIIERFSNLTVDEDELIENAYVCLRQETRTWARDLYCCVTTANNDYIVPLPRNCEYIEAVFLSEYSPDFSTPFNSFVEYATNFAPTYRTPRDTTRSKLSPDGTYLTYDHLGDSIQIPEQVRGNDSTTQFNTGTGKSAIIPGRTPIGILYKGQKVDENGDFIVTDRELMAIAYYHMYVTLHKQAFQGVQTSSNLLQMVAPKMKHYVRAAKVSERLTQNQKDKILDAQVMIDRKLFKKPFKAHR